LTKKRKKFSCDFETTTEAESKDYSRVWAYGYMEIGKKSNYKIGTKLDEFMSFVSDNLCDYYFHNLAFDGVFVVHWLLSNGFTWDKDLSKPKTIATIVNTMNQWYGFEVCYEIKGKKKKVAKFFDSLKKIPMPVKRIAKSFGLEIKKGEIDYDKPRPEGYEPDEEEIAYIKNDIEIVAEALHLTFEEGMTKMTISSDAYSECRNVIGSKKFDKWFPSLDLLTDAFLRKAYRGGFTWCNDRYANELVNGGVVYDVNSLYPYIMYDCKLPIGLPQYFEGKYEEDSVKDLYVQHLWCCFELKDGHIPTIQVKGTNRFMGNEYLKSSGGEAVELFMTNVDLKLMFDHYEVYDIEYVNGYKFGGRVGMFNDFIDKWSEVKKKSEGGKRELAKLMLNSVYGKFGSNPDITGRVPFIDEDGVLRFETGEEEMMKELKFLPVAIFVTSWARNLTIRTAQACYDRIIYCDTDSIHLEGMEEPYQIKEDIHDKNLGKWKWEYVFSRGKYIRQKTYINDTLVKTVIKDGEKKDVYCQKEEATKTKLKIACAGMTDKVRENVTFDNFQIGFRSWGSLKKKNVKGGVLLVDTEFSIKGAVYSA
jgi:hypothetical protein